MFCISMNSTDCHAKLQYAMPLYANTIPQAPDSSREINPVIALSRAIIFLNMMALRVIPNEEIRKPRNTNLDSGMSSSEWKNHAINGAQKKRMT